MTPRKPTPSVKRPPPENRSRPHPKQPSVREVSAGGLVYRRTTRGIVFAMMRDSYGKWTFPKGHVERGEAFAEAAARETAEELGLKGIRLRLPLGKIDIWFRDRFVKKGVLIHKDIHYFLFEAPSAAALYPQVSEGVMEAKWIPARNIPEKSFYRDLKPIISRALAHLSRARPARRPVPAVAKKHPLKQTPAARRPRSAKFTS